MRNVMRNENSGRMPQMILCSSRPTWWTLVREAGSILLFLICASSGLIGLMWIAAGEPPLW